MGWLEALAERRREDEQKEEQSESRRRRLAGRVGEQRSASRRPARALRRKVCRQQ